MNKNKAVRWPRLLALVAGVACLALAVAPSMGSGIALAAPLVATAPGLGAAAAYSVLGKAGVTNTGSSTLSGNVGADSSITGFPPGTVGGTLVLAPAVNQAEADASTADLAMTAQAGSAIPAGPNLTDVSLVPGVYDVGSALLPGVLTLNGPGVYIFLASDLTASGSVSLINGALACDVYWHVTSAASIVGGAFVGTIIAGTSVTFGDAASLDGRALALTGNVTLINNSITGPNCAAPPSGAAHVSVSDRCLDDGRVEVTVGVSAGVTVYGLGEPITSAQDTGENKIVRALPAGRYEWNATPPSGSFMLDADHGVIEAADCAPAVLAATAQPSAVTATAEAAPETLLPITGDDLAEVQARVTRQWLRLGLGSLGLGLVLAGIALRRRPEEP